MEIQRITIPYAQLAAERPAKTFMIRAIQARQEQEEKKDPKREFERHEPSKESREEHLALPPQSEQTPEHIDVMA